MRSRSGSDLTDVRGFEEVGSWVARYCYSSRFLLEGTGNM
jgi:hypothetical protein